MSSLKKIALCTDFSEHSDQAFDLAFDLTKKYKAQLYLIHVVAPLNYPSQMMNESLPGQTMMQIYKKSAQWATKQIERTYIPKMGKYKDAQILVLSGYPANEILNFIDQEKIDLAVMGTHGLTGLAHFFMGSTAESVVRRANCSVLTVNAKKIKEKPLRR